MLEQCSFQSMAVDFEGNNLKPLSWSEDGLVQALAVGLFAVQKNV